VEENERGRCLHTQNLNQEPFKNMSGAVHTSCGCNNNPNVGKFVDSLKTSKISGLAFGGLCGTNCENDGAALLYNLQSLLIAPDASSPNSSTNHDKETPDDVSGRLHVAQQAEKDICAAVHAGDMEVFTVAYVSGSTVKQVFHGVSCDAARHA
jgi:hypothetical protein